MLQDFGPSRLTSRRLAFPFLTVRIFDRMKNGMTNRVADSAEAPSAGEVTSPPASDASKKLLPWLVAVAFFMESLDTTVLNTAVPAVSQALHVAPLSMKAVLASYTLSLAVFIPISGWMADRFGTRHVFAAAIGLFTLGSFLCGISSDIHLLVACRLLQGCGGAMMVRVGRLTLVRTFAKFELIRVMSFVAIPALIGPMFGPLLGGLILRYLDWRYVFFVNIPIGVAGLLMVYLHLPDYREEKTPPLDLVGLILFGAGVALLSYVLEIFGEHTLGTREIIGLLVVAFSLILGYGLHALQAQFPPPAIAFVPDSNLPRGRERQFLHAHRHRRRAVSPAASLSGRTWFFTHSVGSPDHAASLRRHVQQVVRGAGVAALGLSGAPGLQHGHPRTASFSICHHRCPHTCLADRASGLRLRHFHLDAVHQHEHPGLCGPHRTANQ